MAAFQRRLGGQPLFAVDIRIDVQPANDFLQGRGGKI